MRALRSLLTNILPQLLFWSWNLMFGYVVIAILPDLAWTLLQAAWRNELPWDLAAVSLALLGAPFFAVAAWVPIRRDGAKVFRLLFGIEGPLVLVGLVRLMLLREVTPSVVYLLAVVALAGLALTIDLYRKGASTLSLPVLAGHAVLLVTAVWLGAVLGFYVPPTVLQVGDLAADVAKNWSFRASAMAEAGWWYAAEFLVGSAFVLFTVALFAVFPLAFFSIYLGTFWRLLRETWARTGAPPALSATAIGVTLILAPFVLLDRHPQHAAFARLETPPADEAARAALLADESALREGLVAAYLAKYRYWTSTGESSHIRRLYPEAWADGAQDLYNGLTRPFVYQGESLAGDQTRAEALYASFFDQPLQKGEQQAVLHALNATWDRSGVEAGLLDVNGEKVLLARQQLTVTVKGDLAQVQLDEVYRNQSYDQQEIFYYFSLPESAAVTGLWLSDDLAWPDKFRGVLAPRGAAQQVYQEQRQERRDPALLEQVGPRQYRLRAFPILPRPRGEAEGPPLTVRLTYGALLGPDGVPMPQLTERRNVFWDARTERVGVELAATTDAWLPLSIPATAAPQPHEFAIEEGRFVRATPHATAATTPAGQQYALVLDRSLSMRNHADEVASSLQWLTDNVAPRNELDLYTTAGWGAGEPAVHHSLDGQGPFRWFGSIEPHGMLTQYNTLRGARTYDAVLVLTDAGTYDLAASDPPATPETGGPLWLVHLGGAMAPAYDDALLQAIQGSGGGVATSVAEAFGRFASVPEEPGCTDLIDGYRWCLREGAPAAPEAETPFAAIATRAFVLHEARALDMTEVANLDAVHRAAKANSVVTPYSSLIALVDEAQRKRLAELEAEEDRFSREAESGVEALTAPSDVTAVPEPEEWALLLVACGLALMARRLPTRTPPGAPRPT